ncbi:hypothetical protein LXL04_013810 [Taraxacum kok-saghyz]
MHRVIYPHGYTSGVRSLAGALVEDFLRWGNQVVWFRAQYGDFALLKLWPRPMNCCFQKKKFFINVGLEYRWGRVGVGCIPLFSLSCSVLVQVGLERGRRRKIEHKEVVTCETCYHRVKWKSDIAVNGVESGRI